MMISIEVFKMVLEQMQEGVIIINNEDRIIFVNKAAENIRNISSDNIIGQHVLSCHKENSATKVTRALQFLKGNVKKGFTRMITDLKNGKYYENVYNAINNEANEYIGTVIISRDITDKRKLEEEKVVYMHNLEEKVADLTGKLQDLFISSMTSLVHSLEAKDHYTKDHSIRVSDMAVKMAEFKYGVSTESKNISIAGSLHDIGKIGVLESVLNKPGKLSESEFNIIKEHTVIGEKIIMPIERLRAVSKLIRHHHERYDGKGYPDGISGDNIPLGARILAIADSYDAMTSDRPYRYAMEPEKSVNEIERNLGSQFDPEWGKVFLELFHTGHI